MLQSSLEAQAVAFYWKLILWKLTISMQHFARKVNIYGCNIELALFHVQDSLVKLRGQVAEEDNECKCFSSGLPAISLRCWAESSGIARIGAVQLISGFEKLIYLAN